MLHITRLTLLALALVALPALSAFPQEKEPIVSPSVVLAHENSRFALDLYAQLAHKEGNLFFSPYSISSALAMTYAGARGDTAKEMANTLHLVQAPERLHPAFADLNQRLLAQGKEQKFQLRVANRLWGQKGLGFRPEYLKLTSEFYQAGLEELDFARAWEQARRTINAWVAKQTNDKIPELLAVGSVGPDTRLALTNAIYFKAAWKYPFAADATRSGKFSMASDRQIEVPFMFNRLVTLHHGSEELDVVALPYEGRQAVMLLLVPRKVDGLAAIEKQLTLDNLRRWLANATPCQVELYLPRFRMTGDFLLNDALQTMGMKKAFSSSADFSGMVEGGRLQISRVIHKAYVDVNEVGTEAAGATAVLLEKGGANRKVTVRADRPFAFLIQDSRTGSLLFLGRLNHPGE